MPFQLLSSTALENITVSEQQTSKKGQKFCTIQINGEQPLWQLSSEPLFSPFQAGVFQKDSATETRQNLVLHLTDPARETLEAFDTFFAETLKIFAPKAQYHPLVKKPDDPSFPCSIQLKVNALGPSACRFWREDQTPLGDVRSVQTAGAKVVPIICFQKAWFFGAQCGVTAELRAAVISQEKGTSATDIFPL